MIGTHHLEVRRSARICTLGEPGTAVRDVWLACHGFGQLARRFLRRFEPLEAASRFIVAPEGLNRFYLDGQSIPHGADSPVGSTWMTREDRLLEIEDYVRYLDDVHSWIFERIDRTAVRLRVLGFSQGMSTVTRWTVRTAHPVDHLVLWAGSWPPEVEPRAGLLRGARLSIVAGTADRSVGEESLARVVASLREADLEPELVRYEGGHDIDAGVVRQLESTRPPSPT